MASSNCECGTGAIGNFGRPNCVTEMPAVAFPIIWNRYDENGDRNTINVASSTLGADIQALVNIGGAFQIHPMPKTENVTTDRTETQYETFPSGRKVKLDGVGGIRTWKFELVGKDAVNAMLREFEKTGCSDLDYGLVDINGNLWLSKDTPNSTEATGFMMDSDTFDAFKMYATDTTTEKIMLSFDMDKYQKDSSGYCIKASELGYKATSLSGLVQAFSTAQSATTTTVVVKVFDGYGTASTVHPVVNLLTANFVVKNTTTNTTVTATAVSTADGVYTLTFTAQITGNGGQVNITANGYVVESSTFTFL